jgi:hypothetical protein
MPADETSVQISRCDLWLSGKEPLTICQTIRAVQLAALTRTQRDRGA